MKAGFAALSLFALLAIVSMPAKAQRPQPVALHRDGNRIEVLIGGKSFTTYSFDPAIAKAFLQPLRTANGITVTRDLPVGNTIPAGREHDDHLEPHQRAMYFGHGDINGYDFWTEEVFKKYYGPSHPTNYGRMVFRKLDEMTSGATSGTIRATFDLEGTDHKPFAEEIQQFTFSGDATSRVIDCDITIRATHGPVKFGDTKEGSFAVRLAQELDAPSGNMVNSAGNVGEPQIWGKRADWVNVDGVIQGQKLGVAIFDAPSSFRHPVYWHARGYGLLAINPFGLSYFSHDPKQSGSYTVPAGSSIHFRYRVLIHEGTYSDAAVATLYAEYAAHH